MGLYTRVVIGTWSEPPFSELATFVGEQDGGLVVASVDGAGWSDFEVHHVHGATLLVADLTVGDDVREELGELAEALDEHDGSPAARATVASHLASATAVVGLQILASRYDESVAAANQVITFFERSPGVLTQVDTVGWYDGDALILQE